MTAQKERIPLPQTREELYDSFASKKIDPDSFVVITGRGNVPLADDVGKLLGKPVDQPCYDFADGETGLKISSNVRERDVFVLQAGYPRQNDRVWETAQITDASKNADADKITVMFSYYPYARGDKKDKPRTPGSAVLVGNTIKEAGARRLFALDPHNDSAIVFSMGIPLDIVYSDKVLVPRLEELGLEGSVVLAPDAGAYKRAEKFAGHLNGTTDVAVVHKRRDLDLHDRTESKVLVGDVRNRPVVIVDDLISTGSTLEGAANLALDGGATEVWAAAAHGLFVPDKNHNGKTLPERMKEPGFPIERVIVTDSILQSEDVQAMKDKIDIVSVAPMMAVAIMCYLTRSSISERLIK